MSRGNARYRFYCRIDRLLQALDTGSGMIDEEDLPAFATTFRVPFVFIRSEVDLLTTTSVVQSYFDHIASSNTRFIQLPAGNDAIFRNTHQFLEHLVTYVRPLATQTGH